MHSQKDTKARRYEKRPIIADAYRSKDLRRGYLLIAAVVWLEESESLQLPLLEGGEGF